MPLTTAKIRSNPDTLYSNTVASTLYVMHGINQYELLINIGSKRYMQIYDKICISLNESTYHFGGQHNHVGQGSAIHGPVLFHEFRKCPDQADAEPLSTVPADNLKRLSYDSVDISGNTTGETWGLFAIVTISWGLELHIFLQK